MTQTSFQYLAGRGWLIFSGGHVDGSPIRAKAIARARSYGITAYISTADDDGDALMEDMEDLGARAGYFIDLELDESESVIQELETASLIVIEVGSSLDHLYKRLRGAIVEGIKRAYERGGVILLEGLVANLFGQWMMSDTGQIVTGFDWVHQAFIEPQSAGVQDSRAVQMVLEKIPDAIAINIERGSALALGADNQIEVWGAQKKVTLSLGRKHSPM